MTRDAVVPPSWQPFYEATGIPAAIRTPGLLRLTGHTGDRPDGSFADSAEEQIRQTFSNVTVTLTEAGVTWDDVVEINSFHVGFGGHRDAELTVAADFLSSPYPAWSAVGIAELFEPEARYELRCVAVIPTSHQPAVELEAVENA